MTCLNPMTNVIDRLRIMCGDTDSCLQFLDDKTYEWVLSKNNKNENAAVLECMRYILFTLARVTRERAGEIEIYGSERFNNYKEALKMFTSNPVLFSSIAIPYAGGISRQDMYDNDNNVDGNGSGFYLGMQHGVPTYFTKTIFTDNKDYSGF